MSEPDRAVADEVRTFLCGFRSLVLATADPDGVPEASYAPFVRLDDNAFQIYVSELAAHTRNVVATGRASVLLIEPEATAAEIFARRRLSLRCRATTIARGCPRWVEVLDVFAAKFGAVVDLVRPLEDFVLVRLEPSAGLYVRGFGQAYRMTGPDLAALRGVNDVGAPTRPTSTDAPG